NPSPAPPQLWRKRRRSTWGEEGREVIAIVGGTTRTTITHAAPFVRRTSPQRAPPACGQGGALAERRSDRRVFPLPDQGLQVPPFAVVPRDVLVGVVVVGEFHSGGVPVEDRTGIAHRDGTEQDGLGEAGAVGEIIGGLLAGETSFDPAVVVIAVVGQFVVGTHFLPFEIQSRFRDVGDHDG